MNRIRLLALLMALVMLLSLAPTAAFAATDNSCRHVWTLEESREPTCTEPGYNVYRCTQCREQYTEEKPALGHSFGDWTVTKQPTCIEGGVRERKCTRCGLTERETTPALGHSFDAWQILFEATCTEEGSREHKCLRCGYKEQGKIKPLGHDFGEWYIVLPATMDKPGIEERKCARCGLTEQREIPPLAPYEQFALYLVMDPAPTGNEVLDYGTVQGGCASGYTATLMNIGSGTLWVTGYSIAQTGDGKSFSAPIELQPGESFQTGVTLFHTDKQLDTKGAKGDFKGMLYYDVSFRANTREKAAEAELVESNAVSYAFRVEDKSSDTTWKPPEEGDVTILKQLRFDPADPQGFQLGETICYSLLVTNTGSEAIRDLRIYDPLTAGSGNPVTVLSELQPGEVKLIYVEHTVTLDDVMFHQVTNAAYAEWGDEESGSFQHRDSNCVVVPVINKTDVMLTKWVEGDPANGQYYVEGETIHFKVYVKNHSPYHQTDFRIYDSRVPGHLLTVIEDIGPGEDGTYDVDYTVTEYDVEQGSVWNVAWAHGVDKEGVTHYYSSNEVSVPTNGKLKDPGDPFGVIWGLTITKSVTSTPKNGSYYQKGEEISYQIDLVNDGELTVEEGILYDIQKTEDFGEMASVQHFAPGESRSYTFTYKVTADDVAAGSVINYAYAFYSIEGGDLYYAESNTVRSPTNEKGEGEEHPGFSGLGDGKTSCVRTLTGKGEMAATYTLEYCPTHSKLEEQCIKLVEEAEGKNEEAIVEAWKEARALWTEELDKLYETMFNAGSAEGKAAVSADRTCFYAYVDSVERLLGEEDPILTAKTAAELVMNRCADLCYDIHHAGDVRQDSVLGEHGEIKESADYDECQHAPIDADKDGQSYAEIYCVDHRATDAVIQALVAQAPTPAARAAAWSRAQKLWQVEMDEIVNANYKAADADGKKLIAQNRVAFDRLVAARSELMSRLYAGPTAMESVAHLFSDFLIDVCG